MVGNADGGEWKDVMEEKKQRAGIYKEEHLPWDPTRRPKTRCVFMKEKSDAPVFYSRWWRSAGQQGEVNK